MSDGLPSLPSYSVQPAIEPSPPKYAERDPSVYTVESTRAATATTGGKEKERKLRKGRKGWGRLDGGVQRGIPGEDDVRPRGKSGEYLTGPLSDSSHPRIGGQGIQDEASLLGVVSTRRGRLCFG